MRESDQKYVLRSEMGDLNEAGWLKPNGYLRLFNQLMEEHFNALGLRQERAMAQKLAWVLIAFTLEIDRPVKGTERLIANTWYSGREGISFRRECTFKDEAGTLRFQGSCFFVLMNLDERSLYRDPNLPFDFLEPEEAYTVAAVPSPRVKGDFKWVEDRQVRSSEIDCLGHVNNIRYGEYAYDALTEKERRKLDHLQRMEIYFLGELHPGNRVTVLKDGSPEEIRIRGLNESAGKVSFDCIFTV